MSWIKSFFGAQHTATSSTAGSPVDVIIYTASLASSPKAIDPILDGLREVTARMATNKPLAQNDQVALARVYTKLEAYLTSKDPLRTFTKQGLHQKIQDKFMPAGNAYTTFWDTAGLIDRSS